MTSRRTEYEPLAIVGIGCKLPGKVTGPNAFWNLMAEGRLAISEVPSDRWSLGAFYDENRAALGKASTKWGGFVDGIREFDAEFFGISPAEAEAMDPQQRMLLTAVWEAFEDAGIASERLRGSNTAVFVGVCGTDYSQIQRFRRTAENVHAGTGGAMSIVPNRISHKFDFKGPSAAVDTACSSSLVATDLACHAIWHGKSDMAIAGGVNALLDPGVFINFSKANMMSPTGRIRTFDADADGYVRGEGAGAVIIKRLAQAMEDGDRVYSVIRSTCVNQDGQTSTITVPSAEAQSAMLAEACRRAGVGYSDIDYVEAHGTGTPVGDPIESRAIGAVFGRERNRKRRVMVGAGKTNTGHLESAAGITGLIKTSLCLHHREVPRNINFKRPNPNIPFDELGLDLPLSHQTWLADNGRPRRAAVNAFGFGGTNACAVLEEAPAPAARRRHHEHPYRQIWFFPFGAQTEKALGEVAARVGDHLSKANGLYSAEEVEANLALRRSHLTFRGAAISDSAEGAVHVLKNTPRMLEGKAKPEAGLITGRRIAEPRVAFAFAGQGGTWWGMAHSLMKSDPVFKATIEDIDRRYAQYADWSIAEELLKGEGEQRSSTVYVQPLLFALQMGLVARWRAWGIEPQIVLGHSAGELAAATTAGILSMGDAIRLLHQRSRLLGTQEGRGGIAAVAMSRSDVERDLAEWGVTRLDIAAVNAPTMINIAGDKDVLAETVEKFKAKYGEDLFVRALRVDFAPHSHHMDVVRSEFFAALGALKPTAGTVPMVSTVTGHLLVGQMADTTYWWRNIRDPVLFDQGVREMLRLGANAFVEIGPHTNLAAMLSSALAERGQNAPVVPSLIRGEPSDRTLLSGLATLYVNGVEPKWEVFHGEKVARIELPAYPWEKRPYWIESEESRAALLGPRSHPLLGGRALGPVPLWSNEFSLDEHKWLVDHTIDGSVIFPGAGYMEMMFAAGHEIFGEGTIELENVEILEAMVLSSERNELVQTTFEPARGRVSIYSRPRGSNLDWILRSRASVRALPVRTDTRRKPIKAPRGEPTTTAKLYSRAAQRGYAYGPTFQGVRKLWHGESSALALVKPRGVDTERFWFHPAVFDSALHAGFGLDRGKSGDLYLPVRFERVVLHGRFDRQTFWSRCRSIEFDESTIINDFDVETEDGELLMEVHGFTAHSISGRRASTSKTLTPGFVVEDWAEAMPKLAARAKAGRGQTWLVFRDKADGLPAQIGASLKDATANVINVVAGDKFEILPDGTIQIDPAHVEHYAKLLGSAARRRPIAGIVFGWALAAGERTRAFDAATLAKNESVSTIAALNLVQALVKAAKHKPRLWLVTRGVFPIGETARGERDRKNLASHLAGAPLAGFARTVLTEHADFHCSVIDLDANAKAARKQARTLAPVLLGETDETEIALRGERWFVPRLRSANESALPARVAPSVGPDGVRQYRLSMTAAGDLDDLRLVETEAVHPAKGELKIAVKAGGLNFRDVMAATGLLPADAESGAPWQSLGLECSGVVTDIGPGVKGFKRGDRVMTSAKGVFRSEIVVPAASVNRLPGKLSFVDAATVPSAFATAYYALKHLARLRTGETVLVHLGTGGVGLAAIQIARHFGAEVISTAGSREKRAYLKKLGVAHVFDSRSLSFADDVRRVTNGKGVDVVLNALAGEAIPLGVAVMAPNGRFIEIGKRDIYGDSSLGLRALRRNGAFFVLDMARMDRDDPETLALVYSEMLQLFDKGVLKPLPAMRFPASRIAEAFKTMAQAKHIGKVVIDFDESDLEIDLSTHLPLTLSPKSAFLISGGLGGFGAEVARWMADRGARHLYLMSRSGDAKPEAKALIAEFRKRGVKAHAIAADVTKRADVDAVVRRIEKDRVPLAGVIHSAMVLDDGFIAQLNAERMLRVLEPKVLGAWNLHEATLGRDLDFFIMFSSMAAVLGSSGQANYVAGNRFLDILAGHRRRLGLPGLSVNWGALGGAGAVQRNKAILKYLKSMGMPPLALEETLSGLGTLMRKDPGAAGYCKIDWQALSRANTALKRLPRFADVAASGGAQGGGGRIRNELLATKGADRERLLKDYIAQQIAKVLKIDGKTLEPGRPLNELGLDSLTSFQLKNKIESEVGVTLPVGKFLQKPTIDSLAVTIGEVLETSASEKREGAGAAKARSAAQDVSPRQEWLWHRIREDGPMPMHGMMELIYAVKVRVPLDLERVNSAFRDTLSRHKVLRSSFPAVDGQPTAKLLPLEKFSVQGIDAKDLDEASFEAELRHLANTPHDIENGPLIDLRVYWRPDGYSVLTLRAHVLITDGWSFTLLLRDVFQGYFGLAAGGDGAAQEAFSYFDYSQWHRKWLAGPQGEKARSFWKQKLAQLPAPLKVGDHAAEAVDPHARGYYLKRYVSAEAGWNAREVARKMGLSMHAIFAAAYHAMLFGKTGARDIVLVSNIANRTRTEEEQLIGWIANQMFTRAEVDPAASFQDHAQRLSAAMLEAIEFAGYPAHMILEAAAETNQRAITPHFAGFNMMWPDNAERSGFEHIMFSNPGTVHRFGDLEVTMLPTAVDGPGHFLNDTAVIYQELDGEMLFMLHAREGVFDAGGADAFLDRFLRVLPAALGNPDISIAELAQIR